MAKLSYLADANYAAGDLFRMVKKDIGGERKNNKKKRGQNPAVLAFNTPRAEELFKELWKSEKLAETVMDIRKATIEELWEKHGLDEIKIRKLLASLCIVFGGGARAVVTTNMTVEEFENAVENEEGQRQVDVSDHKTRYLGAAPLPFIYEGLYEACDRYKRDFCETRSPSDSLFLTQQGGKIKPIDCVQSLKGFLVLTPEEKRSGMLRSGGSFGQLGTTTIQTKL